MNQVSAIQPLQGPLWPLLLRAGLSLLQRPRGFGQASRQCMHQVPAPTIAQLSRYQTFFQFPSGAVPLCFYYPLLQKAQLASMLQCRGLRVAGLIHLSNSLERPYTQQDNDLCGGGPLEIATTLYTVDDAKGLVLRAEQQVWQQQQLILSGHSDYLLKRAPRRTTTADAKTLIQPGTLLQDIPTAADASRAYARLSGDYNPIHLWPWSARLFGQPQPILHGMASAALLSQTLPVQLQRLAITFKTPVIPGLPMQLTAQGPASYALWQQRRLCLLAQTDAPAPAMA